MPAAAPSVRIPSKEEEIFLGLEALGSAQVAQFTKTKLDAQLETEMEDELLTVPAADNVIPTKNFLSKDYFDRAGVRAIFSADLAYFSKTHTAIENSPTGINLSVTFLGTQDAKSGFVDLDPTAPGVSSIQQAETELLTKLCDLITNTTSRFPDQQINLYINGHSLGGALAQAFTESVMRGIIYTKKQDLPSPKEQQPSKAYKSLTNALQKMKPQNLTGLAAIQKVTLYTKSAPKTAALIADRAALLSEADCMPPIDVYHQEHIGIQGKIDPIVTYGEAKLFAGTENFNRNKVRTWHAVVDCSKIPADNTTFLEKWETGTFGHTHNGRMSSFLAAQAHCNITAGTNVNIARTPRGLVKKILFGLLNSGIFLFVKPIRKIFVTAKRLFGKDRAVQYVAPVHSITVVKNSTTNAAKQKQSTVPQDPAQLSATANKKTPPRAGNPKANARKTLFFARRARGKPHDTTTMEPPHIDTHP